MIVSIKLQEANYALNVQVDFRGKVLLRNVYHVEMDLWKLERYVTMEDEVDAYQIVKGATLISFVLAEQ